MKKYDEDFMRLAVASARDGIERLEFPFGCCIAQDRNRYVFAGNHSLKSGDPTSHAEINTIREWSQRYGAASLKETVIYTTSEPCLMCLGAINWAQIPRVVFGTSLNRCIHHGFSEANIDSAVLTASFPHPVSMEGGYWSKSVNNCSRSGIKKDGSSIYSLGPIRAKDAMREGSESDEENWNL